MTRIESARNFTDRDGPRPDRRPLDPADRSRAPDPGGARYTEIKNGLPAIATNLLADRLRELQRNGIIAAHEAPSPDRDDTLLSLTERGRELEPVLRAMVHWGGVLAVDSTGDSFQ